MEGVDAWMGVEAGWRVIGFVRDRGEEKRTEGEMVFVDRWPSKVNHRPE